MENTDLINKQDLKPHPQEKSNFLSDLFYCWTIPIFKTGLKKELSEEDLYQTLKTHESNPLANQLEEAWNVQLQKTSPSLWKVIWNVHKWEIIVLIIMHSFQQFIIKCIHHSFFAGSYCYQCFQNIWSTGLGKTDGILFFQ
jgi:ATP-binding cassette subfamily C (CFTR/MRP) protein 4